MFSHLVPLNSRLSTCAVLLASRQVDDDDDVA